MTDHYATLGIRRDAEFAVIEGAHRFLMKRYHPDLNPGDAEAAERAKAVNAAFDVLKNAETRARYDHSLPPESGGFQTSPPPRPTPPPPPPRRTAPPQRPSVRSTPVAKGGSGGLLSMGFIGLAVLVGVGAVGSLMQRNAVDPAAATEAPVVAAAAAVEAPARASSGRPERRSQPLARPEPVPEVAEQDPCGDASAGLSYWRCADPAVGAAERRLNRVYAEQLRKASNPEALEASHRDWQARRDAVATDRDRLLGAHETRLEALLASDLEGLY